ncbi:MAG: histidinol dehydrogenase, partial [Nitrosopumilus sp.]|nr:histidinol dehydrogenase [Nitrosopumilus sp.]
MKIIRVSNVENFVTNVFPKQSQKNKSIVNSILKNVQKNGDSAIIKYEKKLNNVNLTTLRVTKKEILSAYSKVSKEQINAIKIAKNRL